MQIEGLIIMNADQIGGVLRALIPGAVVMATHYGIGSSEQDTIIFAAIATAIVAIWSAITNKPGTVIPSK